MPIAILPERALVTVTGPDAEHLLQTLVTTDLDQLGKGVAKPGALLSPQGKILFDFLISRVENGFRLECRAEMADLFVKRLMMYRLRAKAGIDVDGQTVVAVSWQSDSTTSGDGTLDDLRFSPSSRVVRTYATGDVLPTATEQDWNAFRIASGIPESGSDYPLGEAFPHDALLDQLGGVGFKKGCYVGQEVVSRMHHRGTTRRRVLIAHADTVLPDAGTDLSVAGRSIGTMGSSCGPAGLALVRIDKVKAAMDDGLSIMAGNHPVTLSIPAYATFTFPEAASVEEA